MVHPLFGAWVKINRASEQLNSLKTALSTIPEKDKRIRFRQYFDAETNIIHVFVDQVPDVDPRLAAIAADCLQNLRAALNYLTWELAKWNLARQGPYKEPDGRTQFPIALKAPDFQLHYVLDLFSHHVYMIERFQPYVFPIYVRSLPVPWVEPQVENHPLAILQKLTNADKHRILQLVFLARQPGLVILFDRGIDCEIRGVAESLPPVIELNTKWATFEVIPTGPKPRVDMNNYFATEVAFKEGWSVIEALDQIGGTVTGIIRDFEPVF